MADGSDRWDGPYGDDRYRQVDPYGGDVYRSGAPGGDHPDPYGAPADGADPYAGRWPDAGYGPDPAYRRGPHAPAAVGVAHVPPPESSRPRRVRPRHARRRRGPLIIGLVVVLLLAAVALDITLRVHGDRAGGVATCAGRPVIRVVAAPELLTTVRAAAGTMVTGDRGCAPVVLSAQQPAETLAALDKRVPDVWIPSSGAWLAMAATPGTRTAGKFPVTGVSLARSPVVVAMPRATATALGWPQKQPTWAQLGAMVYEQRIPRMSMADPGTVHGLLGLLEVHAAMARTTPDQGIAEMRALTLRSRLADPRADPADLVRRLSATTDPKQALSEVGIVPVLEQTLWTALREHPDAPVAAVYPPDGLLEADYPAAISTAATSDPDRRAVATDLLKRLRGPEALELLRRDGFRAPAGTSGARAPDAVGGVLPAYPAAGQVPTDGDRLAGLADQWTRYQQLPFQVLVVVDGSASMNDQVTDRSGHRTTKAELLRTAGSQAAELFGSDTSVGLWFFASPNPSTPPYREVVPYGPINEQLGATTRRQAFATAARQYQPYDRAGTPLFETIRQAVTTMRGKVRPDAFTLVMVLTDGRDGDSPYTMSLQQLLESIRADRPGTPPVPVFSLGYGRDADMPTLEKISQATGGKAVASADPGDLAGAIAKVFLAAHQARR